MQTDDLPAGSTPPILLRLRSGKIAALVIAVGFAGGTLVLGTVTTAFSTVGAAAILGALLGYGVAVLPLLALAAVIAACKSELWLLPEERTLRMLTYRPWRLKPRIEEAPLSEYAGVRTAKMTDDYGATTLVSLVTTAGEDVPLRQFKDAAEARKYAEKLGAAAELWVRGAEEAETATA